MNTIREHIILKFAMVILTIAMVTPSVVKLFHVFENHEHEVCVSDKAHHFHQVDIDCEFYKFKKTGESYMDLNYVELIPLVEAKRPIKNFYLFLNSHQQSNVKLRGPPLT